MRILVVEDEAALAGAVKQALEEEGFAVDTAGDGESGIYQALAWDYDVILLDIMMPKLDGWQVLEKLREKKKTPVLMLTARDAVPDRVRGLNSGADDYLTKPFDLDELLARVGALVRRSASHPAPVVKVGDVEINTASKSVTLKGKPVELAAKEYALAEYLALHRGTLVTRTMIYDHIYDDGDDSLSNVVDVYISTIRRKLGKGFVETRRGQGYMVRE